MTDTYSKAPNRFLLLLIVVLLLAVGVQGGMMFRMMDGRDAMASEPADAETQVQAQASPSGGGAPSAQTSPWTGMDPIDPWQAMDEWDPFVEMRRMHERMNRLFEDSFNRFQARPGFSDAWGDLEFAPSLDLRDAGDAYVLRMDIPGVEKSDIQVNIEDRVLSVSGRTEESVEDKDGNQVLRKELRRGQFHRSVSLPGPVKGEEMAATYDNGVLTIRVPKGEEPQRAQRIDVL